MSAYKRFEMWLYGNCPNCKERKLSLIKPKKPIHFKCLNCDSKYYFPHFWNFILTACVLLGGRLFAESFDFTSIGFGYRFVLTIIVWTSLFIIFVPKLPKKPYITDENKVVKWLKNLRANIIS